jgi:hypothetical protein
MLGHLQIMRGRPGSRTCARIPTPLGGLGVGKPRSGRGRLEAAARPRAVTRDVSVSPEQTP